MTSKLNKKNEVSPRLVFFAEILSHIRLKLAWSLMLGIILSGAFYYGFTTFRSTEKVPEIKLIDMSMHKEIRNFSSQVETGIFIKNFDEFNVNDDSFTLGAVIWFSFLADEAMLDTISQFSFINGKILEKSAPDIRLEDGGRMFVKYDIRLSLKSSLNYYAYPFDDHTVSLLLTNNYVTPDEIYFSVQATGFQVAEKLFTGYWTLVDRKSSWGYTDLTLDTADEDKSVQRPTVVYSFLFQKPGPRSVSLIFLPLLASLFLGFISLILSLSTQSTPRFTLSLGAFTAILSYRFVIDRMIPSVGYFTLADTAYMIILLTAIIIFAFQVTISRFKPEEHITLCLDAVFFYSITSFFTCLLSYFIIS